MTDAPKIDTQAPVWPDKLRIRDTGLYDDLGGPGQRIYTTAGRGYERQEYIRADLSAAREAAAAQAMREAAAGVCQEEQERREWQHKDQHAEDGGWQKERFRVGAQQSRQLADKIAALPLPDPAALDRLIAEREAAMWRDCLGALPEMGVEKVYPGWVAKTFMDNMLAIRARGSKEPKA